MSGSMPASVQPGTVASRELARTARKRSITIVSAAAAAEPWIQPHAAPDELWPITERRGRRADHPGRQIWPLRFIRQPSIHSAYTQVKSRWSEPTIVRTRSVVVVSLALV